MLGGSGFVVGGLVFVSVGLGLDVLGQGFVLGQTCFVILPHLCLMFSLVLFG